MKTIIEGFAIMLLVFIFIAACKWYVTLPVVFTSYSTHECVKVLNFKGDLIANGCKDLPSRYQHVIVK